jgi:hypothetical protein
MHQDRRRHRRARGVSAHADHYIRAKDLDDLARLHHGPGQVKQRAQPRHQADVLKRPHLDTHQTESRLRHQAIFHTTRRPYKQHFRTVTGLKFTGNGQCGDHVSAGASACNQNAHWPSPRLHCSRLKIHGQIGALAEIGTLANR